MIASERTRWITRRSTVAQVHPGAPALMLGPGEYLPLTKPVTMIGRSYHSDLQVEEASVCNRHAAILRTPAGAVLVNDRSTDGTYVNSVRITRVLLEPGDRIQVGNLCFEYVE